MGVGIVVFGLDLKTHEWQVIYFICTLTGFVTLLMFFTFPETAYNRSTVVSAPFSTRVRRDPTSSGKLKNEEAGDYHPAQELEVLPMPDPELSLTSKKSKTWTQQLRIFSEHRYTDESLGLLVLRPVVCLVLLGVLWATLINSVTVGMIVVISSNFSTAFRQVYGFEA